MEMPCGNLKRLINYPSIALTTGYQRLNSKSYPHSEHLEPWTVYLWLGLNFDLSFFLWRRIFSFLYAYLFLYHQRHTFLSLESSESRAWAKGSCATILLGKVHQESGVKHKGSEIKKEIEPIQESVLSWSPVNTTDYSVSQDHIPCSHVSNVSGMSLWGRKGEEFITCSQKFHSIELIFVHP